MALSDIAISLDGLDLTDRRRAQIEQLTIELDECGGPESATLVVAFPVFMDHPPYGSKLRVTYKGQALFVGRLVSAGDELGDGLAKRYEFEGLIKQLDDHKAFRRCYVNSDLDEWRTDQGPQTASNVWEVSAS